MIHPEEAHDFFLNVGLKETEKPRMEGRRKETKERKEGGRKEERKKTEERENPICNSDSVVWFAKIFNSMSILYFLFFLQ